MPMKTEDGQNDGEASPVEPLAGRRGRREMGSKKAGRLAALERLKKAKEMGKKAFELEEMQNVYDVVDEDEYCDIVRQRQEDDWIVDDDGCGYVEDGREIFDDDLVGSGDVPCDSGRGKKSKSSKLDEPAKKKITVRKPQTSKGDLRSMFAMNAGKAKKKEKEVKLEEDDLLGELLNDLHNESSTPTLKPKPIKKKLKTPKMQPTKTPTRPGSKAITPRNMTSDLSPQYTSFKTSSSKTLKRDTDELSPVSRPEKRMKPSIKVEPQSEPEIDDFPESMDNFEIEDDSEEVKGHEVKMETEDEQEVKVEAKQEIKVEPKIEIKKEIKKESINPAAVSDVGWETIRGAAEDDKSTIPDVHIDVSSLPLVTNDHGEQVLRFYWLDAYEDQYKQPGVVYLFGKVFIESAKTHVSCCVAVKDIERTIYLLPRKKRKGGSDESDVTMMDVYQEFDDIASKYNIMRYRSKKVSKQYCFEVSDVPAESEYLEVRYGAEHPPLPSDLSGSTFSHVFGTNTTCLELLLLDRRIKGPSWIDIKKPQPSSAPFSWCKVEATCLKPDQVSVYSGGSPPPIVTMTISMKTVVNTKTHQNEIVAIAGLIHNRFPMDRAAPQPPFQQHFCAVTNPSDGILPFDFKETIKRKDPNIVTMPSERALLGYLLARVHKLDPDVIVGHDVFAFDLDVLLHRINANKVPHWSRVGRLKRNIMPKPGHGGRNSSFAEKSATCGRLVCDIKISARELIRSKSYDLTTLTQQVLKAKQPRIDMPFEEIKNMFMSTRQLMRLVEHTLMDANLILQLMCELNVIPLALQLTNICGNVMSRTLMGGRSERNEHLLLHAFHEKNFICPDKQFKKKTPVVVHDDEEEDDGEKPATSRKGRRKPAYAGGLVLEPKKGFYDQCILLLDFNSLYPSIIQEYNICFTTIASSPSSDAKDQDISEWIPDVPDSGLDAGILPTEIRKLVERRREVKKLMKQPDLSQDQKIQYDIRQKALKLTANSMYGCLGFSNSRFYAKPLAALVTSKGREILMHTKDMVEKMNLEVIYGDTDSIMVNSNCTDLDQVFKLGNKVKAEVNKLYRLLEIDIDGVFKSMLLLKKKKYAALSVERLPDGRIVTSQELKGLDIVRRDWCDLAKEVGNYAISQILSAESRESIVENIHSKLIAVGEEVVNNQIDLQKYEIHKNLTKSPQDYPDKKSLPHVQVAIRLNQQGGKKLSAGDTVSYIICEDGSNLPASQRAYHPDEIKKQTNLIVDGRYYRAQQIHPVVSRLCDPIDGTDAAQIAQCLGLDPSGYRQALRHQEEDEDAMMGAAAIMDDEERFKNADRFKFTCPNSDCKKENIVDSVFYGSGNDMEIQLGRCGNKDCAFVPIDNTVFLQNKLTVEIRGFVQKYYAGWLSCEDSSCGHRTRSTPLYPQRQGLPCLTCNRAFLRPEYTDKDLYTQLCFFQFILDVEKALQRTEDKRTAPDLIKPFRQKFDSVKKVVDHALKMNGYSEVNLCQLFEGLFPMSLNTTAQGTQ